MIQKLVQKENIPVEKHEEIATKIFKILTEQVSFLTTTKQISQHGRATPDDPIISTFTQQLYILSLSALQNLEIPQKFQNMMQAYVETAEKILEELQGSGA